MNSRCGRLVLLGVISALALAVVDSPPVDAQALGTLRVKVLDAATGAPTTCAVTLVDSKGSTVLEKESFRGGFRCAGQFVKHLPAGHTQLRITRGLETRAVERVVDVPAGGELELSIELERVVDLRKRGWYAGDSHVHMLHGERTIPVTFDEVALAAQAQDLQYLSLAQDWILESVTPEKLESELGGRSTPGCVLTWNLEAPKNYYRGDAGRCLGHCWSIGMSGRAPGGQSVIDVLLNASAHDYQSEKPSFANFESQQLIHAQGGTVFYTHPARWWTGSWGGRGGYPVEEKKRVSNMAVELPLDTLIGPTYDGVDVLIGVGELEANAMAFDLWCLLLNHGYRVAATGSSDACFDRPGGALPGTARTYTWLPDTFSLPAVAKATALGRTFVTTGPLLLVTVDGQPPGSAFKAAGQPHTMKIEAWASGADARGLTRLELLRNGTPVNTNLLTTPTASFSTNLTITESEPSWFNVRLVGSDPRTQRAISGAFFFDAEPFVPPAPVPARISVALVDADTGAPLSGSVTELTFRGTLPEEGKTTAIIDVRKTMVVSGTARLRAQAEGYRHQILSPFFDDASLLTYITQLRAENLLKWETFEHVRALLNNVKLTFRLQKNR
jgi:hypothetical protein